MSAHHTVINDDMRFITWVAFATNATGTTNTPIKQKQRIPTRFSSLKFSVQNVLERLQPWDLGPLQKLVERCDWQKKSDSTDGQANRTQRDLQLRNATLYFLSSNTTAYTQQLDEVIIKTFQDHYWKQLAQHYIERVEKTQKH